MRNLVGSNPWRFSGISRVLFYSTQAPTPSFTTVDSLYSRICGSANRRVSIVPVLNQWVDQGRDLKQAELQKILRQLRKYRRFKHALQISEWMSDERNRGLSSADVAVRLDLISEVHGLEQAEKYFDSIPDSLTGYQTYGALLNCYAKKKCLNKAESIFQKMRELDFMKNPLSYNVMLTLYSQVGKHDELDILIQEMEGKGIKCNRITFNIRLNAYAATSDIEGMEKLLMKIEANPSVIMDWYSQFEKGLTMLRKAEKLIDNHGKRYAYEQLLNLYALVGNKDEVYRIWNLYKNMERLYNSGYVCMSRSLLKLDDIDGAEKILEEWESGKTCLDFRVPYMLISAYCKKELLEKAKAYVKRLTESGKEPDARIWNCMATEYHMNGKWKRQWKP